MHHERTLSNTHKDISFGIIFYLTSYTVFEVFAFIRVIIIIMSATSQRTSLDVYQLLDVQIPAILTCVVWVVSVTLFAVGVSVNSYRKKRALVPEAMLEMMREYFPTVEKDSTDGEITVSGVKNNRIVFAVLTVLLAPLFLSTVFITFWNAYLVEETPSGVDCTPGYDCFPIETSSDGSVKILQRIPVDNCSVAFKEDDVTFQCYRFLFDYADGIAQAAGVIIFAALYSTMYFGLIVAASKARKYKCIKWTLYIIIITTAFVFYATVVVVHAAVPIISRHTFRTTTNTIQFVVYSVTFFCTILAGVFVIIGTEC